MAAHIAVHLSCPTPLTSSQTCRCPLSAVSLPSFHLPDLLYAPSSHPSSPLYARPSQVLILSSNIALKLFPSSIARLPALRSLDVSYTPIDCLPESFGALTSLEALNLSNCVNLTCLPGSLQRLTNLTSLDLSATRLIRLPLCVGNLPKLRHLDLHGCGVATMAHLVAHANWSLAEGPTGLTTLCEALPPSLVALNLSNTDITSLPDALSSLTSLEQLSLRGCTELKAIPDVQHLANLTSLNLIGCGGLDALPNGLKALVGCCVEFDDGEVIIGSL